jgi:DNA-binding beta-propeller fold protein YncE
VKPITVHALVLISTVLSAQQPARQPGDTTRLPLGVPGPDTPKGKAPEQGYVPDGWHPHAGGLLKYSVQIRFGEEPETMPDGMRFGRVSAVTTDSQNQVYVFKRDPKTDQVIVFDAEGKYLRSWGRGMFGRPHGLRVDRDQNVWAVDDAGHQILKFTREGKLLQTLGTKGVAGSDARTFNRPTDVAWDSKGHLFVADGY